MLLHCVVTLMFLNCVRTSEYVYDYELENAVTEWNRRFSYWPSPYNALARRFQKRDVPIPSGYSDGGKVEDSPVVPGSDAGHPAVELLPSQQSGPVVQASTPVSRLPLISNEVPKGPKTEISGSPKVNETASNTAEYQNETKHVNVTANERSSPAQIDLSQPGVVMRGVIVFGGFLLLAVAYSIFYRSKSKQNDQTNNHNTNDTVQFRYGVLQNEERNGNMELSRVPLTMESDEEDDEDLEIFDLEQKKKSLSYVNLQTNDEEVVFDSTKERDDKENLLLDIEDPATDTLINWSNNGNKSIL